MTRFVVYSSNDEVLITTKEGEVEFLNQFYNSDRNLDTDYDREEIDDICVMISNSGFTIK